MEIEKLKLERKFFNDKSADRNDERICKKPKFHINRRSDDSDERYVKDIFQEIMECELADELGYEKSERTSNDECGNKSKNYISGFSERTNPALHHSSNTLKHKVCQLQTHKGLMADLKKVYQAISEEATMNNLILFKDKWGKTYSSCVKS